MPVGSSALFVYGTLLQGEAAHHHVSHARAIVPARARGRLYHLPQGYPALVDARDGPHVDGELCRFDHIGPVLDALDEFEGYRPHAPELSDYLRVERPIEVLDPTTTFVTAWCYVVPRAREPALLDAGALLITAPRWSGHEYVRS